MQKRTRVLILGAAGRDFHNFNVFYREDPSFEVVGITATQIPNIDGRIYPPALAGPSYPKGIPIYPEVDMVRLIKELAVDQVVFSYSDVPHTYVMHVASVVLAAGADFGLLGGRHTMLRSTKPVVAITAVRTGAGKSPCTRRVVEILRAAGKGVVVVRHPMPYGDLERQACQRFACYEDMDKHECTVEEREEYEPHIERGAVVYAGVDYERILRAAEAEADVVLWDGGNNDLPFYAPDLWITVADPHRAGHEVSYHPGEVNLRSADAILVNKVDTAKPEDVALVRRNIAAVNPGATVIEAASPIFLDGDACLGGKKVLVVEDGPTLTHGEMAYGAGVILAKRLGAELVDPRPYAVGSIAAVFQKFPHIGTLLPAMGYGTKQVKELEETINRTPCDMVLVATPIDIRRVAKITRPAVRARYEVQEIGRPDLRDAIKQKLGW